MNARRDLIAAQSRLNVIVGEFVEKYGYMHEHHAMRDAWHDVRDQQLRLDGEKAHNGRATSVATSRADLPRPSTRLRIIEIVTAHWAHYNKGITVATLTNRLRGKHQTVSAAVNHLMERGWLVESGELDSSDPQHPKILWAPSQLAIDVMREVALEAAT